MLVVVVVVVANYQAQVQTVSEVDLVITEEEGELAREAQIKMAALVL